MALTGLGEGELTFVNGVVLVILAFFSGALGGAFGGILVGGKHLGNELAAMMGAFFGPVAAMPGVAVGLIILALLM
ncbi:hypothetical protein [Petrachloros mirabilis]